MNETCSKSMLVEKDSFAQPWLLYKWKKDIKIVLILNSYLITSNMKKKINGFWLYTWRKTIAPFMVVKAEYSFNSWKESANILPNKTFVHLSLNVNPNQAVKSCFVSLWEHESLF